MSRDDPSGAPPGPDFRVTRRGYDRGEVDREVARLADRIGELEASNNRLAAQLSAVGLEGGGADVRSEIETATADIGRILQSAREAAEGLRARAAEDAANWRQAAQAEAIDMRRRAQEDAEALRQDAWQTGTGLLDQVQEEAERIRATAEQDAILTRAEAEQEAHRLTSSARKEVAEESRLARLRSERVAEEARAEAERVLEEAHREAEAAQERVRALEQRRAELMREVETARSALTEVESDLEAQRSASEPEPVPADDEPAPAPQPASGWEGGEVGTVRIVSPSQRRVGEAVDADAMADEVRRLRERRQVAGPTAPVAAEEAGPAPEPETAPVADGEPVEAVVREPADRLQPPDVAGADPPSEALTAEALTPEPKPEPKREVAVAEPERQPEAVAPEPEPEPPAVEPEPEPEVVAVPEPEPVAVEPEPEPDPPPPLVESTEEPPPEAAVEPGEPPIDDLFARLRGGGTGPAEVAPEVAPSPLPEPIPETPDLESRPDPAPQFAVIPGFTGPDPFELRDRLLLPVTNRALREAKRAIVDLQNLVLEELRTQGNDFEPDPGEFRAALAPVLGELAEQSRLAGSLAAAELVGAEVPRDVGGQPHDLSASVAGALETGVRDVIGRSAAAGGGPRQTSAAVSRLFRAWRTDEAERQVRSAAFAAYHGGMLAALEAIGIEEVQGRPDGRACAACPAGTGERWPVAGDPPEGTVIPPARIECACTVVPAR